jgi:hypothetical protein
MQLAEIWTVHLNTFMLNRAKDSRSSPTHTSLTQDRMTTHFGCRAWLWMAWDVNEDEIMRSSGLDAVVSPESNEQCHTPDVSCSGRAAS